MIETEAAYDTTRDAMRILEKIVRSSFLEGPPPSRQHYVILTEPAVAELLRLRAESDEYIGLTDYLKTYGVPLTKEEIDALGPIPPSDQTADPSAAVGTNGHRPSASDQVPAAATP